MALALLTPIAIEVAKPGKKYRNGGCNDWT